MKQILAAIAISSATLATPTFAGNLSDPVVTPAVITAAAEESSGSAMAILIITATVLLITSMN